LNFNWHPYRVPRIIQWFFPAAYWNIKDSKVNKVLLTFDDGPIPELTPWVLDQLDIHYAKAIFFCVGDNLKKHPDVAEQIVQRGHILANHTFNHLKCWKTDPVDYLENVSLCAKELNNFTDADQLFFRPPYGQLSRNIYNVLKKDHKIVMWSLLSGDYNQNLEPAVILKNLYQKTKVGDVVVFHDNLKATNNLNAVLPSYLDYLNEKGWLINKKAEIDSLFRRSPW
jgi:peptidoglycan/xylan/chitin deacetylase (PgdA/CDA1 family)